MNFWKRMIKSMEISGAHRAAREMRNLGYYREADDLMKSINRDA